MEVLRGTYLDGDGHEDEEANLNFNNPNNPNNGVLQPITTHIDETPAATTTTTTETRECYVAEDFSNTLLTPTQPFTTPTTPKVATPTENVSTDHINGDHPMFDGTSEGDATEDEEDDEEEEEDEEELESQQSQQPKQSPKPTSPSEEEEEEEEEEEDGKSPSKKQKPLSSFIRPVPKLIPGRGPPGVIGMAAMAATPTPPTLKKPKKKTKNKNNNVWTKSTSRKGKKKGKLITNNVASTEDTVLITPVARFPDRSDDSLDSKICLSKVYKAEKVELSEDRLSAGSSKGYRMVRATRGVVEGAWYFEIKVSELGESGHTRLGWSTDKGDLQAPVGYDGNSFGYRDVDGSKVHKAVREKYGDGGYVQGDVIGFYINLPDGALYAPKPPHFVWFKGQKYMCATDGKEESLKVVPGSEISFFKNGVCQGTAFKDLHGGRYYPAASMYTLPNQPNCTVRFNFGPEFENFPQDFEGRPLPRPMIDVPYLPFDGGVENGASDEKKS